MITVREKKRTATHHDHFEVREPWDDRIVVLSVRIAVDLLSAPRLTEAIGYALARSPAGLIVDLTEADFLASAGMSVLLNAREQADEISVPFAVVADGVATGRPIRLLRIDAIVALYPTLEDALRGL